MSNGSSFSREIMIGALGAIIGSVLFAVISYFVGAPMKYQEEVAQLRKEVDILKARYDDFQMWANRLPAMEENMKSLAQSVSQLSRRVTIEKPQNQSIIRYDYTEGNKGFFTATGLASGLKKGDYLSILLKVSGGEEWWCAGESMRYGDDFTGNWSMSMLSVDLKKSYRNIVGLAVISENKLQTGQTYKELPYFLQKSEVSHWIIAR
ncbi:hypothetical protein Ctha_0673 [Chloroherpeton thalassium ATCC 35110]|uniref:Uncharacterized protein n=1 Tax=Chloroherpeton thalassium (strain ATCC 35110 / GB-78) TaxID=517418 RepID=B3QVT5_CHLT3|nr:hypothetical protein [Chloroherpeton thalassium]ACF13142.1 hypothetical protein Ctha_0673 [Chloroherpeton thalassium ATCC 35110]